MICLGYFKLKSVILKKSVPKVIDFNPSVFVTISHWQLKEKKKVLSKHLSLPLLSYMERWELDRAMLSSPHI